MEKGQGHESSSKSGKTHAAKGQGAPRGFAAMDAAKQREIARKGGESVPPEKRSFSRDHELAAQAGRKGGESVPAEKRSFSRDHGLAAEAGREGGKHSHGGGRIKSATTREEMRTEDVASSKSGRAPGGQFEKGSEAASEAGKKGGHH